MSQKTNGNALVTGAHGFLGRHLVRHLASQNWDIIGIGLGEWSEEEWRRWGLQEWHPVPVTRGILRELGGTPDVLFHCAGSGSVSVSMNSPALDFQQTVGTTIEVLEYARVDRPGLRLVYPSSAAVYGQIRQFPVPERHELSPSSPYGVHKKQAEDLIRSYSEHFGVASSIVRFFSLYGPELRKQLLWDACNKLSRGESSFFGSGDEERDWLHVRDAAQLLTLAAEHAEPACPVVNGGVGQGTSIREVLEALFACFDSASAPNFTGASRAGDPDRQIASISRALEWGWKPLVDWRSGMDEYVKWFKEEGA